MRATILFYLALSGSLTAFAGIQQDFDAIKNSGRSQEAVGSICEDVAQLRFAENYPEPQYRVVTGISYSDKARTLGELDVIVFNNSTHIAEIVAEVKCWRSAKSGLKKAKEQRQRFLTNVHSPKALKFSWLQDPSLHLTKTQFNKVQRFLSVAQKGTMKDGFDIELPYSLNELMDMRAEVIRCQDSGACVKPTH